MGKAASEKGKKAREYALIVIGSLIMAFSMNFFLVPQKIAPGGVSGVSTILYHTLGVPISPFMLAANAVLFALSYRTMGRSFLVRSLLGAFLFSALLGIIPQITVTSDVFLSCIYGGALMGLGMGLVIRGNSSTGGTDLIAQMIHSRIKRFGVGWVLFAADFVVVAASAVVFSHEQALYALAALYISAKVVELVIEGVRVARAFYIVSDEPEEIANAIMSEMERGVTMLYGRGMYSGGGKSVLMCVVSTRREINRLKNIVKEIDPNAFVIISNVHEVMGEGF